MNTRMLQSLKRRSAMLVAVMLMLVWSSAALAQSNTRKLRIGDTLTGSLDARTFAQTYTFDAVTGGTYTITAISKTRGLLLALLLTDAQGQTLNEVAELTKTEVSITNLKPQTGTYYVTVLRATGVQGNTQSTFTIALSGTAAPAGGTGGTGGAGATAAATQQIRTISLAQGMEIALAWNTTDDLNLEVRDPIGGAINLNNPSVASGGRLSGNANGDCATANANAPTERTTWAAGAIPLGSYEIIVYYVKSCALQAGADNFTVTVTVDGRQAGQIAGTIDRPGQNYVAGVIIDGTDQINVRQGGTNTSIDVNPFATKIAAPGTLAAAGTTAGRIDRNNAADVYTFDVVAGDSFSVEMLAVNGGSLDPYLVLLGPTNQIVIDNDDESSATRNSLISVRNATAGQYKIVVTRFGLANGGTEGDYNLIYTRGTGGQIVAPIPTNVPGSAGQPTSVAGVGTPIPTVGAGGALPQGSIQALLSWNSRADLRILIRDPQGRSLYTDVPRIDSGGVLFRTANLNCQNTSVTPQDYAYWTTQRPPAGTYEVKVFQQSNCNDTAPTTFSLKVTVAGQSVIEINDQPPGPDRVVFLTSFTVDAAGNATKGAGGFVTNEFTREITPEQAQSAPEIVYNQSLQGELTVTDYQRLYFFKGFAGDKITITLRRAANTALDPYLILLAPDGKAQLQFNDDATGTPTVSAPDSQIRFQLTADGNYLIIATRYGVELGGTTGRYTLQLAR